MMHSKSNTVLTGCQPQTMPC